MCNVPIKMTWIFYGVSFGVSVTCIICYLLLLILVCISICYYLLWCVLFFSIDIVLHSWRAFLKSSRTFLQFFLSFAFLSISYKSLRKNVSTSWKAEKISTKKKFDMNKKYVNVYRGGIPTRFARDSPVNWPLLITIWNNQNHCSKRSPANPWRIVSEFRFRLKYGSLLSLNLSYRNNRRLVHHYYGHLFCQFMKILILFVYRCRWGIEKSMFQFN